MGTEIIETTPLWKAYGGIEISNADQTNLEAISRHIKVLKPKETFKILSAFNSEMYDMGVEYAWNRAMKKLDTRLGIFGLEFIAEMVGYENLDSIDSISKKEKINLAFELGMIDSTAKMKLTQANEIINHYLADNITEEVEHLEALMIFKNLVQYILGNDIDVNNIEFIRFRNDLKGKKFAPTDTEVEHLQSTPYFFIKTTIRTILNLIKTEEDTSKKLVLHNAIIFIEALWNQLFIEDKKNIGTTYAVAINNGDKDVFKTFSTILDKVQGYDYVPETTRSNSYIKVAKSYISTHYAMNNFYNEPAYAKKLNNMGTVIPDFALNKCIEAIIISRIGNRYGVATAAQPSNNKILKKITYEQWKEFFSYLIVQNQNILEKITYAEGLMLDNWFAVVEEFVPTDFNIKDRLALDIYNYSLKKNKKVKDETKIALNKIVGK